MTPPERQEASTSAGGRGFLSDLLRDVAHLRQQQEAVEKRLKSAVLEYQQVCKRLDALEASLESIADKENNLAINVATREGKMAGERSVWLVVAPLALGFLTWFIPATLSAIRYAQVDEDRHRQTPVVAPPVGELQPKGSPGVGRLKYPNKQ